MTRKRENKKSGENKTRKSKGRKCECFPRLLANTVWKLCCQMHSQGVAARCQPVQHSPSAHLRKEGLSHPLLFPLLPPPYHNSDALGRRQKEPGILSSHLCSFCNFILLVCLLPISSLSPGKHLSLCVAPADNLSIPLCCQLKEDKVLPHSSLRPFTFMHLIRVCALHQ